MIETNLYKTRTRDGVKVYTRFSMAYVELATMKYVSEIPEGASESDYAYCFSGHLRQDDTGVIYECAHDVEDSAHTYTEVFPDPADACEWEVKSANGYYARPVFNAHKAYNSTETYAAGDIRTYNNKTYQSDFDDNTGNTPDVYGWTEILPYVEKVEPTYKTLEELYPDEEEAAE